MRYVYDFDEDSGGGRELLGGKGIGLAEMTALGVPVPAGFTITTDACRAYMGADGELPDGLDDEIEEHVGGLEAKAGKRFGDRDDPLLVSVRSGAAVSMPGMMDTILNLGLNDDAVEGLAKTHRQPPLRARLLPPADPDVRRGRRRHRRPPLRAGARRPEARRAASKQDVELTDGDLAELIETYKRIYAEATGADFPQDARDAARRAPCGPSSTRGTRRARRSTGATYEIPDDLGTAVNVVQMVFGNKGDTSGTGVCFTRDPSTGESRLYGEFLAERAGRGRRRRDPHARADRAHG